MVCATLLALTTAKEQQRALVSTAKLPLPVSFRPTPNALNKTTSTPIWAMPLVTTLANTSPPTHSTEAVLNPSKLLASILITPFPEETVNATNILVPTAVHASTVTLANTQARSLRPTRFTPALAAPYGTVPTDPERLAITPMVSSFPSTEIAPLGREEFGLRLKTLPLLYRNLARTVSCAVRETCCVTILAPLSPVFRERE